MYEYTPLTNRMFNYLSSKTIKNGVISHSSKTILEVDSIKVPIRPKLGLNYEATEFLRLIEEKDDDQQVDCLIDKSVKHCVPTKPDETYDFFIQTYIICNSPQDIKITKSQKYNMRYLRTKIITNTHFLIPELNNIIIKFL